MLLDQHNAQLEIVKAFLDGEKSPNNASSDERGKALLMALSQPIRHIDAFNMLRGHSVISPYMRVLYHLLKYIEEDFYIDNATIRQKKKYTSVIRSLIRNDVLFLVAVNASYIIENGVKNQYASYQRYLHDFDFFEHAIFFSPQDASTEKNEIEFKKTPDRFEKSYRNFFSSLIVSQGKANDFEVIWSFPPAIVVSYIYKNPMQENTHKLLSALPDSISGAFDNAKKHYHEINKASLQPDSWFNRYIGAYVFTVTNGSIFDENHARSNYSHNPVVDHTFINNAITTFKASGQVSGSLQFYYFPSQPTNQCTLTSRDLKQSCSDYFSYTTTWEMATDDSYKQLIISNQQSWQALAEEIKLQKFD